MSARPNPTSLKGDTIMASITLNTLPKRKAPGRTFDADAAVAILEIVSVTGEGYTDGVAYADSKSPRNAANAAKRLLNHVAPTGMVGKTAIFGIGADGEPVAASTGAGSYGFALWLVPAKVKAAK